MNTKPIADIMDSAIEKLNGLKSPTKMNKQKNPFDVLKEMNQHDIDHGTRLVSVSNNFISADKVKGGCKLSMGLPESVLYDIMNGKVAPILMIVDKEEYDKRASV